MDEGDYDVSGLLSGGNDTNFDLGNLNLGDFNLGDLGNFNLSDLNLGDLNIGDLNLGDQTQGLDLNSILEGLKTDREGGQNLDLESLLKDIGGNDFTPTQKQELHVAPGDYTSLVDEDSALKELMGNKDAIKTSDLSMGDLAENVGGAADQSYNPEAILKSIRSGNEAVASGMSPGSVGAEQAVGGENENLTGNQLAEAYGTSGKGSVYTPDEIENRPKSIAEAIASGNAPGSMGAKMLASGELNDEQANALYGTGKGLTSLTSSGKSKNEAIASGASPGSIGAKMLAEAASNNSSNNAFTPAEEAALVGKTPTSTSTGISKNQAVASGMSPGSAGAKAAAAGELSPEELAAAQGVVTKGSVYNPVTSAEKTVDALKKIADAKAAAAKTGTTGSGSNISQLMMLLALMAMMNKSGGGGSSGATIPSLSADRKQLPYGGGASNYRPGQGGVNYFTPTTYTTKAAGGGLMSLNGGGHLGGYSDGGHLLRGPGDGVSDSIPATIGGKQPARLATGEFVVPARIVSELGNGSTDAGAQRLYEMMDRVQRARRKTKNVAADTKAAKYLPA